MPGRQFFFRGTGIHPNGVEKDYPGNAREFRSPISAAIQPPRELPATITSFKSNLIEQVQISQRQILDRREPFRSRLTVETGMGWHDCSRILRQPTCQRGKRRRAGTTMQKKVGAPLSIFDNARLQAFPQIVLLISSKYPTFQNAFLIRRLLPARLHISP